jgi:hypothetical protein
LVVRVSEQCLEVIRARPGISAIEVAREVFGPGAVQPRVNGVLQALVNAGALERRRDGGAFRYFAVPLSEVRPEVLEPVGVWSLPGESFPEYGEPRVETELDNVLRSLGDRRQVFHSEADFQHALAWEIQKAWPEARIRLEVPLAGLKGRGALDIVVTRGGRRIALEVKYFKASLGVTIDGERFDLPATVARDIARHDFCKDLVRLEHAIDSGQVDVGFAVLLCNDSGFWSDSGRVGIDEAFKISDGRRLEGTLTWHERAGAGTIAKRDVPLCLRGSYPVKWMEFCSLGVRNGIFRALVVPVVSGY